MKKTNKIISILLVLAMLLSMAPLSLTAFAAETVASGSTSSTAWSIDSDGVLTIDGKNNTVAYRWNSAVIAPWDDYADLVKKAVFVNCDNWTQIPDGTFRGHSNLTDVTLPPNITRIGEYAFTGAAIRTVVLPDSVTLIDYDAFSLCENLTYINIPDGVETIRGDAFNYCYALKAISIPDSVTTLCAFSQCKSLTAVRLGNGLQKLSPFRGCSSLQSIVVPPSINALGSNLFGSTGVNSMYYQGTTEPTAINTSYSNHSFYGASSSLKIYVPEAYSSDTMGIKSSYANGIRSVTKLSGYLVNSAHAVNGVVTVDKGIAAENDTVNITLVPYGGYEVESVSVKQGETDIAVTGSGVNYSFTMPAGDVTVSAVFKESLHIHDFTYSAEGTTLKAVCSNTDGKCNYPVQQITANNSESYSFNKDYTRPVTFEGVIDGYYPEATYTMNGEPIEGEPYYPGEYVATLTKGDATLSVSYSITKATPSSSLFNYAKPSNLTYDGTAKYGTVTLKDDVEGLGDFTVIYRLGSSKGEITEPIKAGKYYMRALVEEGEYYKAGEVSLTNFTISCDHTACGTDYVPNNDGTHNETYGCGTVKTSNTDCSFADGVCEYCEYACLHEGQTGAVCELCKKSLHTHSFTYTASVSGDRIVATCTADGCPLENGVGGYITISAPADLYVDGNAKEAVVDNQLADTSVTYEVTYSTADGAAPKTAGTYTASVTLGDATASVEFTLLNYVASVTDKDGKLIGNYTTFADAITAAKNSAGSTLTLLDNTEGVYAHIVSPVTLDLNGYTLDMGNNNILVGSVLTGYDPHVTLTDTSEAGTGKIKGSYFYGVFNVTYSDSPGKLTVQGGTIEYTGTQGAISLRQNGATVEMSGGSIKSTASTISIANYQEDFDGSVNISGGSFPDGLKILVNSTEYTSTVQYLADLLAEGYAFYNENGNKITVADDATEITGYVQVKEHFVASVTDKDGNAVGSYKTLADAVTAAEKSEDSTLTLLDDITLTEKQYINSGKFTLDLNGKTLFNETDDTTLWIESGADVTVKDSGEGGTVKSNAASSSAILNNGTLTVESGNIISEDKAVNNNRTLTVNGGSFEGKKYALYISKGTTEIYGGEFNGTVWGFAPYTINDGDFTAGHIGINCEGGVLTVNGGTFDIDEIKIYKGTVSLSGGEFKNGFTVYDLKYDSDAEQFAATFLADGYYYKDADGKIITVADDAKAISGYAKVAKGADFANDAVITLSQTEYEYNGGENKPAVTVTVGGKTLDSANYTVSYADNINAGTATVTVTAVESDIYSGTATANFTITKAENSVTAAPTANTLTYNGSAQALITAGSANGGEMQYSTDGVEYSATIPTATNAGDYTVYYKVVGDANHNDTEPATVTVTIKTKDISDAFIILGDALTYTGEEQTQTVTTVEIPDDLDVTYTVSGNKATNVGIYLLTVTGTGNFSGEAKIAYEIAVDASGIDGITPLNVKSSDKEKIEYVYNQLDNAVTDLADDAKKAEWDNLKSDCVELLKMIESVADKLEGFKNKLAGYDIDTVTSDDADDLESFYNDEVAQVYNDYFDNLTEAETKEFDNILSGISALQKRISDVANEITRITDAVNGYDKATVKSSDKADLEQLLADINALTTGKNITDTERADLLVLADTVNELLAVISDTANEINRITDAVDAYDIETVTSADKADLEQLIDDIKALTDGDNITDAEREQLNGNNATLNALLDKIGATADEIARIENAVNGYDEATVKSTDKADIEQLIEDIKALTDGQNITDEERTNLENLDATADALLAKIAETTAEYDRVIAAANGYDEATVTSADKDALVQLNEDIYALALTDNVTTEEIENLENAHDKVLGLIDKLTGISDEIKRIIEAVDKYVFESVKSTDKADIQQLIADIKALLDTHNITADERTLLETADETCDKLVAKIDETVAEINRINDATNAYDIDTVTSADKADIEKLLADIKALTDGDNITDTEREQLDGNETTLSALLDKIGATADEIARIENAVNSYDEATVKSTDKADLEQLVEDIKALTDATNITAEEKAALEALDATADSLIKKIDDTAAEIARIDEAVNAYDEETVKSSDIPALGKLIDDIKALTDGDNLTEDEKAALEADDAAVDALVEKLAEVAEEIKRVDEAVKSYDENTVKSTDKEDIAQLKEDVQALIDSTNTTENEKTALGEMIKDIEALEDKIDETAKEIERIENAVNGYDEETVKSSDEEAINQLKEDIQTLIDSGNVTEEEIKALEETKADADALTDKIDETQAEIDRINDAVDSYTEDTVKSTDTEAIEQLKEDIQNLIDGGNVTDEEISSLEDAKDKADNLTDKIAETENQLEEIGNIENGYDSETVTSDDKAAIEDKIAEIEAVNPDNLTDEQKAEYEEIKAGFEALLEEIAAAEKAVEEIGVELEMFDENRVTIFWEDDIEALKAKIDELLADENMGTAEKAKLNEYKAQCDNLIEIIHNPCKYFSCRFFYFIWDCLTWKYNGILWLFSNLFGC